MVTQGRLDSYCGWFVLWPLFVFACSRHVFSNTWRDVKNIYSLNVGGVSVGPMLEVVVPGEGPAGLQYRNLQLDPGTGL